MFDELITRRGGDANIGLKLPELLRQAGLGEVGLRIVQPAFMTGPVKHVEVCASPSCRRTDPLRLDVVQKRRCRTTGEREEAVREDYDRRMVITPDHKRRGRASR